MHKKYQVFVSSTYRDLAEERQEVIQALLELDCIPVGMELFPAADDDQWTLIKRLIDDCDYYILIIGGRYGSLNENGVSYTQMEYEYALTKGIPIISFLHKNPDNITIGKSEKESSSKYKLEEFKRLVEQKMCRYWESAVELGSQVSRSLVKLIRDRPRPGWIRADKVASEEASREILELKNKLFELETELNNLRLEEPRGAQSLKQGDDKFKIEYVYDVWVANSWINKVGELQLTWNEIFFILAPLMVDEAAESDLKNCINDTIYQQEKGRTFKGIQSGDLHRPRINDTNFQTIKIQFRALGLIAKSDKRRSIKDSQTYWTLTTLGDHTMVRLRALTREE